MTLPDPPPGPSPAPTGPPPVDRPARSRRTAALVAVAALLAAVTLTGVAALAVHAYRSNEARKSAAATQQDTPNLAAPSTNAATDPSGAAGGYSVRYELLGDGTADLVSWIHNNVPTNQENVPLPWRQEERHDASYAGKGIGVTLLTQKPVTCRIIVDGVLLKEQTSIFGCYVRLPAKP